MDSILDKALEFLGRLPTTPETREVPVAVVEEKEVLTPTRKYEVITEEDPLLAANKGLFEAFPNLIFEEEDLEKVIAWIKTRDGVSLDIETHGHSKRKEDHKKEALSFVKGVIRLVQLSSGGEAFTLDAALLPAEGVAEVLGALRGKALYLHNAIFDLPAIRLAAHRLRYQEQHADEEEVDDHYPRRAYLRGEEVLKVEPDKCPGDGGEEDQV